MQGIIVSKLKQKTVLTGESAKAWQASAKAAKKPFLGGVQHGKRLFTPAATLKRSQLDNQTASFLDKASKTKTKAFAKYKKHWTGAAGDNVAEGLISAVKQTARRLGSVRGGRLNEGGRQKALAAPSSASLLRCSGLWNVLDAAKVFRESCSSGGIFFEFFFLTCQVRVVGFYVLPGSSCSPPDPNSKLQIKVFPARPPLQAQDQSVPRQTSTASSGSHCSLPDLNHKESPKIY